MAAPAAIDQFVTDHRARIVPDDAVLEMVVVNATAMVGPLVCGSHPLTWGLWGSITGAFVAATHSGYSPPLPAPLAAFDNFKSHDLHHERQGRVNFGVAFYIGDRLAGTYAAERKSPKLN